MSFSTALVLLVLGLLRGNDDGWGSATIVSLFAGAAVMLAAFAAIERRVAEPMLPLELFRSRAFTGVQLAAFAVSASLFALFLYLTLICRTTSATRRFRRDFVTCRSRWCRSWWRPSPSH